MNEWISTEERLPEIGIPVLIHAPYEEYKGLAIGALYQPSDRRKKPYWQWLAYWIDPTSGYLVPATGEPICPGSDYVTHWMPLPEAPNTPDVQRSIDQTPTADVVEVKHGHWIEHIVKPDWLEDDVEVYYNCSECGTSHWAFTPPYCPECGAKMDGERRAEQCEKD